MSKIIETKHDEDISVYTKESLTSKTKRGGKFYPDGSGLVIGSAGVDGIAGTEQDNVKLHRAGNRIFQFVPGNDTTADGVKSTNPLRVKVVGISGVPLGSIIPWIGGYFTDANNNGFSSILANTITDVNNYLLTEDDTWKVCDGSEVLDADSPIFNVAGRHLPNLTDSRFIAGATIGGQTSITDIGATGGTPGSSAIVHNHTVATQPTFTSPSHFHGFSLTAAGQTYSGSGGISGSTSADGSHSHTDSGHTHIPQVANGITPIPDVEPPASAWGESWDSANTPATDPGFANLSTNGSHSHSVGGSATISHTHGSSSVSGTVGDTGGSNGNSTMSCTRTTDVAIGAASNTENRPKYLSCFYIIKFK